MSKKEYLKMAAVFVGEIESLNSTEVHDKYGCICEAEDDNQAKYISHAINSHDELVAENERLRKSLSWAVDNLPFEHPFEWSDDENADAHYDALRALGFEIEE